MTTTIATATLTMREAVEHLFLTLSEMEDEGVAQLKPSEVRSLISDICCIGTGSMHSALPEELKVTFIDAKERCDDPDEYGTVNFRLSGLIDSISRIKEF